MSMTRCQLERIFYKALIAIFTAAVLIFCWGYWATSAYASRDNVWMPTCLVWIANLDHTADYAAQAAKFDMILFSRLNFGEWYDYCGATRCIYDDIKSQNPDIKIMTYILGGSMYSTHDTYVTRSLNDLGRWDVSRGHSQGAVHLDNDATMLLHSGGVDINFPGSTDKWLINPATTGDYFNEAVWTDLFDTADGFDGSCDGVYFDNVMTWAVTPTDEYATRADYGAAWGPWFDKVVPYWHTKNKQVCTNSGPARSVDGRAMWDAWWTNDNNLPDYVVDEYTAVTQFGSGDIQFYSDADVVPALPYWAEMASKTHLVFANGLGTYWDTNDTGIDNYGRIVTRDWIEQYAFGVYCLIQDQSKGTYFALFDISSGGTTWDGYKIYREANLGPLNLGDTDGGYYTKTVDGVDLYLRKYSKGYVVVNLSSTDVADVSLSSDLGITDSVKEVMLGGKTSGWKTSIDRIPHHYAVILRKFDAPKAGASALDWETKNIDVGGKH